MYRGLFSFTGTPRLSPFLCQSSQSTKWSTHNLKTSSWSFSWVCFRAMPFCSTSQTPSGSTALWQRCLVALTAGHQHQVRLALVSWPQHPPHWDAALTKSQSRGQGPGWHTAQALQGAAAPAWKTWRGLSKGRWKVFHWPLRGPWFPAPSPPWQPAGVCRRAWRGEEGLLEEAGHISASEWQVSCALGWC